MILFLTTILFLGCRTAPPPPPDPLDASWIATVAREPERFATTLEGNGGREAWQAFHRSDWLNVQGTLAGSAVSVPEHRARAELALLERLLSRAQGDALLALAQGWAKHSPDQPVPKWLIACAQRVAELRSDAPAAERWRAQAVAAGIVFDETNPNPFVVDRMAEMDLDGVRVGAGTIGENAAMGSFWDPTLPAALEQRYTQVASPALGVGLPVDLFGPIVEAALGTRPDTDDVEACRAFTVGIDTRLDAWSARLNETASPDGKALLQDLQLVQVGRSRTLTALAVDAVEHHRNSCAAFYAEQALDQASSRQISPVNTPTVFAVLAVANVETGHVREALDALSPLRGAFPESIGVIETIGDLAVQQGLERTGLSREN